MLAFLFTVIKLLIILCAVATIHEFGHFLAAKLFKTEVNEFSIGFGPKIVQKEFKGTMYSLRCLPLGGYVDIEGEEGISDSPNSFKNKSTIQKVIILVMGVVFNAILAAIIFFGVAFSTDTYTTKITNIYENSVVQEAGLQVGDQITQIDNKKVKIAQQIETYSNTDNRNVKITYLRDGKENTVTVNNAVKDVGYIGVTFKISEEQKSVTSTIDMVSSGNAALEAGLKAGDKIVSINGTPTNNSSEVIAIVKESANQELDFEIERKGEKLYKKVTPKSKLEFNLGIYLGDKTNTTISYAFYNVIANISSIVGSYVDIFRGKVGVQDMSGIVGVGEVVSKTNGLLSLLNLMGIISLAVGVANIMPFPPLDGGKIVIVLGEAITRKKISENVEAIISYVGFGLLILLTIVVTYNDITRIL